MPSKPPTREELNALKEVQDTSRIEAEAGELVPLNQPNNIPNDVWLLIQENGRIATERLNELLRSPRFHRLRAGDQAKLIKLAQDRAYGAVSAPKEQKNSKFIDMTADVMRSLSKKSDLPEYRMVTKDDSNE